MVKYYKMLILCILSWIFFDNSLVKAQNSLNFPKPVKLIFDVYNKNLHVIVIKASYVLTSDNYFAKAHFNSAGVISLFINLDMMSSVQGEINNSNLLPNEYQSSGKSKGKKFVANIDFNHKQNVKIEKLDPAIEDNRDVVTESQRNNSIDILSAMLQLVQRVRANKNCNDQFKIFDGSRIFTFQSKAAGTMPIPSSWTSPYKGEAIFCKAVAQQTAGLKRSRHRALSAQPQPGYLWFKEIDNIGMLPVRFEFNNPKMGNVIVILRQATK